MTQIEGYYQLVKNENYVQHLTALGVSEETAKLLDARKTSIRVEPHNGNKITLHTEREGETTSTTFILNKEVEEKMPNNYILKSTASLNGNQLTITSKNKDGRVNSRLYDFTANKLILTMSLEDSNVPTAKRHFNKV